jgi:hypothetical protein
VLVCLFVCLFVTVFCSFVFTKQTDELIVLWFASKVHRKNVAKEIVNSEENYVENLKKIIKVNILTYFNQSSLIILELYDDFKNDFLFCF